MNNNNKIPETYKLVDEVKQFLKYHKEIVLCKVAKGGVTLAMKD